MAVPFGGGFFCCLKKLPVIIFIGGFWEMSIQLFIVVLYVVALFGISWTVKRRAAASSVEYTLAGRKLPMSLIMVSVIGLAIGGASTIGVSEQAFNVGLSAGWYTAAWGLGAVVMGLFAAKAYRKREITTIPEMLEIHYEKKGAILAVACQIFIQLVIISLQYVAGGSILHAILPEVFSLETGMITSAVVFIGITFIGGMWSASISNVLNTVLIYGGIIIATIVAVKNQGGMANIALNLPEGDHWLNFTSGVGWETIAIWVTILITVNLSLQSILQIALGAKDTKAASRGFVIAGISMIPVGFVAALLGVVAKISYPDVAPTMALPQVIMDLNPWLAGITLAALWAADVSTACGLLLASATLFSRDIYKRHVNPKAADQQVSSATRWAVIVLGLVTFLMALQVSGILNTIMIGLSLCAAFSVILLFTLFAPSFCRKNSAFYTLLAGIVTMLVWYYVPAVRVVPHLIYAEWIVCLVVFGIIYLIDSEKIKES